jgi:hypothetical protein
MEGDPAWDRDVLTTLWKATLWNDEAGLFQ